MHHAIRSIFNAEAPPPMIWEPNLHGRLYPDRPFFLTRVRQGMVMIPPALQVAFREAGAQVVASRRGAAILDFSPTAHARLLDSGLPAKEQRLAVKAARFKIALSRGVAISEDRLAFIPQTNFLGTLSGNFSSMVSQSTAAITLHEIGHIFAGLGAMDGFPPTDQSAMFRYALQRDRQQLPKTQAVSVLLKTHIPSLDVGNPVVMEEFFAELFRENIMKKNTLSRFFPRSAKFVADEINNTIKGVQERYPDFDAGSFPKMDIGAPPVNLVDFQPGA